MNLRQKWIQHLTENNMTYVQHMKFAIFYAVCCLLAGLYLIVHSILPCFFPTAGSDLITNMSQVFKKRRDIDDT
jgi:hypothetical protein